MTVCGRRAYLRTGYTFSQENRGICVLVKGNMAIGVNKDDLMVRVGAEEYEEALKQPHARPMDFTGRPLKGFVYVGPAGYETEESLRKWVMKAVHHAESLGPKKRKR